MNIEDVIEKYCIKNPRCDFVEVASILEPRVRKNIRNIFVGSQTILKQQKILAEKAIFTLQSARKEEVMERFKNMKVWIEEAENSIKRTSNVEKILCDSQEMIWVE